MDGQSKVYRKVTDVRLIKIGAVGSEATATTHNVTCSGNAVVCTKVAGVTPLVGDYVITGTNCGWATETATSTHLPFTQYVSEGYRPLLGGGR